MHEPGDLVHAADYAFAWRALEPRPDPPRALLVLLHGVGGDERQLAALGARAPTGTLVVLPRGPRSIGGDRLGWFREGFDADGPHAVEAEAAEALDKLVDFVSQLQSRFDVPASRTVVGGFSQGGILASSAALTAPDRVAGFFMVGGRVLAEHAPRHASARRASHLRALVVHGRDDETLAVEGALAACNDLRARGIDVALRLHAAGHALERAMEDDVVAWLRQRSAGPGRTEAPDDERPGPCPSRRNATPPEPLAE